MGAYALVGGSSASHEYPGLAVTSCGIDSAVFNAAMLTSACASVEDLQQRIALADQHYSARRLGWTFWLCEDLLPEEWRHSGIALFRKYGLHCIARAPGMYGSRLSPPARLLPHLEFARIEDERTRLEFAHLSSSIFSLSFSVAKHIYGSASFWKGPITGWIGYDLERPVAIVTVVIGGGVAGVYSLGTLPAHRRRGIGEAALRHALGWVKEERRLETTVLQTTKQGMELYRRAGYQPVTMFSVFLRQGCDSV